MMAYTPTEFYDRKFWDKHSRRDDKPVKPSHEWMLRILSGELLKGVKQDLTPATPKPSKLTSAKPAREILKAIKAGQQLFKRVDGSYYLSRYVNKHLVHKNVKAKFVLALLEAGCLIRRGLQMILPQNYRKSMQKTYDALKGLAAKSLAKGVA